MTFAIAPADHDWFYTLKRGTLGDIANFWTPTPWGVRSLSKGDPWYFMLKSPVRKIAGYGLFSEYQEMTASEAWKRYGLANGGYDLNELVGRVQKYAEKNVAHFSASTNPSIGCVILSDPVFWDDADFFDPEAYGFEFSKHVVKFKTFDAKEIPFISKAFSGKTNFELVNPSDCEIKRVPKKDRKGQPAFRREILKAYNKRCAVTKVKVPEVLQAAHIQPYIDERSNHVQNGMCLRADLHDLFDEGLLAIDDGYHLIVSERLKRISPAYGKLSGRKLKVPEDPLQRPSRIALKLHRENIFAG